MCRTYRGSRRPEAEGQSPKAAGRALRERVPRAEQAVLSIAAGRPDAVAAVEESNAGRLAELTPIRVGRMAASPFAFLRGSAGLMAHDLAAGPVTGVGAQICGDAHAANFGLYGDARGGLVIDLNDFDETLYGPWEWDVKRLATSLVLAGREAGAGEDSCRRAAQDAGGRVSAHDAAAGEAARHRGVERHRRRGVGLAHRCQGPAGDAGAGGGEGA